MFTKQLHLPPFSKKIFFSSFLSSLNLWTTPLLMHVSRRIQLHASGKMCRVYMLACPGFRRCAEFPLSLAGARIQKYQAGWAKRKSELPCWRKETSGIPIPPFTAQKREIFFFFLLSNGALSRIFAVAWGRAREVCFGEVSGASRSRWCWMLTRKQLWHLVHSQNTIAVNSIK